VKSLFFEVSAIVLAGALFAFAANALSPAGLGLSRNYFPGAAPIKSALPGSGNTNSASALDLLRARFALEGLQLADSNRVVRLFHDPQYEQGSIVFVDARNDEDYREAHIPGAYEFDNFHPEKYFTEVMPVCQVAEQIVVYCNGGDCEDSEHAAIMLRDAGVPKEKLWVYSGGITEWASNGLPEETGLRNSGTFLKTDK